MEQENIQQEDVSQVVEAQEGVIEDVAKPQEDQETESDKERNFARLRESKEEVERKARLLEQENLQLRQWYQQQMQSQSTAASSEGEEQLDVSDAVDSDALNKVVSHFERKEKKKEAQIKKELSKYKAELKSMSLRASDPEYLKTIEKYLPGVLEENSSIKDIIAKTPEHEQISVMYQFAKANPSYVMDKMQTGQEPPVRKSSIEKNMMQTKTLGSATGHSAIKNKGVWDMNNQEFDRHLQDIARQYP